jgi:hypothetical protein
VSGAILILIAFSLSQFRVWDQDAYPYLVLNLIGAAILGVDAFIEEQWGFVLLETVWVAVSLWALGSKVMGHRRATT